MGISTGLSTKLFRQAGDQMEGACLGMVDVSIINVGGLQMRPNAATGV